MNTVQPFAIIHGGLWGQPERRQRPLSYRLYTNERYGGRPFVVFDRSPIPSGSLFDLIWYLDDAIARGFITAPRPQLTIAARGAVR